MVCSPVTFRALALRRSKLPYQPLLIKPVLKAFSPLNDTIELSFLLWPKAESRVLASVSFPFFFCPVELASSQT